MIALAVLPNAKRGSRRTFPTKVARSSRLLVACLGVLVSAAIVVASPAFAENREYSCEACTSKPGPNISRIDTTTGENKSGEGVCAVLWKYDGGTSYNLVERHCEPKAKAGQGVLVYKACIEIKGHGDVESTYKEYNYKLWGIEGWMCD